MQPQPSVKSTPVIAPIEQEKTVIPANPKVPQVIITRTYGQRETTGTLNLIRTDGTFWTCKTLELPWIENKPDVSCIPTGNYPATLKPFHNLMRYLLQSVFGRTAIFIHDGNYATGKKIDTEGCIILGSALQDINGDGQLDAIDSVATNEQFIKETGGQPITVQIR